MAKKVPLGIRGEAEETVEHKHTLNHHHDKLPPIYSTPNMIGLMEWAAANAMLPFLDEGEISVGTAINIEHRAPTTIGDLVKTEAVLESHNERFYIFRVTAHNGKAEIGRGTVTRAIVNPAKVAESYLCSESALGISERACTIVSVTLPFTIQTQTGTARSARIHTAHGDVETPAFMPVGTAGTVKAVPQDILEDLGAQIILGNTYHLYLRPGHELVRKMGGLHKFMSWERALLTDSGGFQVFSLSELRKVKEEGVSFRSHLDGTSHLFTPERSMEIQIALGADIVMAFDECTEHPAERERARASMEMTLRWAKRSKDYFEAHKHEVPWGHRGIGTSGDRGIGKTGESVPAQPGAAPVHDSINRPNAPALFGIVQGGMYADLRRESAERTIELDFPGYAIGGLSVGESRAKTMDMIATVLELLPKDKPRYVMGVGYPEEIVQYAAMGVDMMDCVLPTRAARHGLLFTSEGRINIKNARYAQDQGPADPKCGCRVCSRYTRAYLRHLFVSAEPLAGVLNTVHNLAFYLDTMLSVRHAIRLGDLSGILSGSASLT